MIDVSWSGLQQWLRDGTQPKNYVFAAWINQYIGTVDELPHHFLAYDWGQSHHQSVVVFYDERLTVQTLKTLHDYLRHQSCDIENIMVVTSHALGASAWWKNYISLHQDKSFQIEEWLFVRSMQWKKYFINLRIADQKSPNKNIQRFFNSYSGTNPKLDRQYLSLKLRGLGNIGAVDMISDFSVTKQQLINHAYYLGYFKNISEEQQISSLFDSYVQNGRLQLDPIIANVKLPKVKDEIFDGQGSQYHLDSMCLATVINETTNSEPWCMVSEKTLRPFWHHSAVIHPGYQSTSQLETLGFWFPHDIIDYAYQNQPDWLTRINQMMDSIKSTHDKMSNRYQEYWSDNYQRFRSNAVLLEQYHHSDHAV